MATREEIDKVFTDYCKKYSIMEEKSPVRIEYTYGGQRCTGDMRVGSGSLVVFGYPGMVSLTDDMLHIVAIGKDVKEDE